jgi:drug/metabolite transporter (DMT)-like permease
MDPKIVGVTAALLSAASWALGSILFKRLGESISPFGLTLSKGAVSTVLLVLACLVAMLIPGRNIVGGFSMSAESAAILVASGLLGIAVADTLFFAALQDLGPFVLIILLMLGNVLNAVLAVVYLHEIPPALTWVGMAVTLAGIAMVLWTRVATEEQQASKSRGVALGFLSVLAMSVATVVAKPALKSATELPETMVRMAAGTAGIFIFGFVTGQMRGWLDPLRNRRTAGNLVSATAVVTFGGFWLSMVAIKNVDVAVAGTLGATEPLFLFPMAVFFLKEDLRLSSLAGACMAVLGAVLMILGMPH